MKILVAVTYFTPYVSGLTIYASRIACAWARQGHEVVVLTSQHSPDLPLEEMMDGVRVVRAPVLLRITKGVIMPAFWLKAIELVKWADVVNLHLPQFDAAWLAFLGHLAHRYTVLTYHCDIVMPSGVLNRIANRLILWMNDIAGHFCDTVVGYTEDYANYSLFLPRFREKLAIIQPPVELPLVSAEEVADFGEQHGAADHYPIIGMACRLAADKGVEVLLDAMPKLIAQWPKLCVFFAGPYQDVLGERAYYERLKARFTEYEAAGHWVFLGSLPPREMAKFYQTIEVLTMPSLNRTDSFGLVQIEAMMNGKPVVAANLPGIRVPVTRHEMGAINVIGDSDDLADKLIDVISAKTDYTEKMDGIRAFYNPDTVAKQYIAMFERAGVGRSRMA